MIECGEVDVVKVLELETGKWRLPASLSCALTFTNIGRHVNLAFGSAKPYHGDISVKLALFWSRGDDLQVYVWTWKRAGVSPDAVNGVVSGQLHQPLSMQRIEL